MTQGGKPIRETMPGVAPSPFARLKPLVREHARDVADSLAKLAKALGSYGKPARIHIRLIDGDSVEHWEVKAGSPTGSARRKQPKTADVHIVLRNDTWMEIAQGRLSPFDALFGGKLRVGGDVELAKALARHLSDPSVPFVSPC
jgi:hypothetical protein